MSTAVYERDGAVATTINHAIGANRTSDLKHRRQWNEKVQTWLVWLLIGSGIGLRVLDYLHNRSIWIDEAAISMNIANRTVSGLMQCLDYNQAAPALFLLLEKSIVSIFGMNEFALRSLPLVCGIAAVPLFYVVARRYLSGWLAVFALALFATNDSLVRYSSEVKQYSGDVLCVLLISYCYHRFIQNPKAKTAVLLGLVGGLSLWLSFSVLFVLTGLGLTLLIMQLVSKRFRMAQLAVILPAWAISAGLEYLQVKNISGNKAALDAYWQSSFFSLRLSELPSWSQYSANELGQALGMPWQSPYTTVFIVAIVCGLVQLIRRKRWDAMALVSPVVIMLVASALHMYPIACRLLLFIVPSCLIFVATSLTAMRWRAFQILAGIVLLLTPVRTSADNVLVPRQLGGVRPAFLYFRDNWQKGDWLYVYFSDSITFMYYRQLLGWSEPNVIMGERPSTPNAALGKPKELDGKHRIWLLTRDHDAEEGAHSENCRETLLASMRRAGRLLDMKTFFRSELYLFDLTKASANKTSK